MLFQRFVAFGALLGLAAARAVSQTGSAMNLVPKGSNDQESLDAIERQAGGRLPNLPPPPTLSATGIVLFQLIAFNENLEVAFFDEIISNITNHVPGYKRGLKSSGTSKSALLDILRTVKAQEQLHAKTATDTLQHFNATFIPSPCTYKFPTDSILDAINLAETLTAVVLGTLQDAEEAFARNGDFGPVRIISSVIGQEGEQNGFYRLFLDHVPSEKPFLTTSVAAFAFSALQDFIVSCPFDIAQIPIPVFPRLKVLTKAEPKDTLLRFSADLGHGAAAASLDYSKLYVTYLVGQQLPISEPIANPYFQDGVLTFDALFPFEGNVMDGLTIAALTNASYFPDADSVVANTLAAPGLIDVDADL
ncbi:sexual development protein [Xylariaceae sp. FL0594]|nr:sexual development protein [Xylariaceae sp. FL0594]